MTITITLRQYWGELDEEGTVVDVATFTDERDAYNYELKQRRDTSGEYLDHLSGELVRHSVEADWPVIPTNDEAN